MEKTKVESQRKARIEMMRAHLESQIKEKKIIELDKYENLYCFKNGVSKRTFREYLDIAMFLAGCKIDGGFIEENA